MPPRCELRQGLMMLTTEGGHRQRADLDFVVRIQPSAFDGGMGRQLIRVKQVRYLYLRAYGSALSWAGTCVRSIGSRFLEATFARTVLHKFSMRLSKPHRRSRCRNVVASNHCLNEISNSPVSVDPVCEMA